MTQTALDLSPEQKIAHDAILQFVKEKTPELKIGGYAGTGKTTLIAETIKALRENDKNFRMAFCCFTGKAAYVLRQKLNAADALEGEYVGTIHGLMYEPVMEGGEIVDWRRVPTLDADLVVVDEASMVGEEIYNDLKSYKIPILWIGDHGQLPPVGGRFNLMEKPDFTLTQIHRQVLGNPIIQLSVWARESGRIPLGLWENEQGKARRIKMSPVQLIKETERVDALRDAMFLCGRNATRVELNQTIRAKLGYTNPQPQKGERVICLRNNREIGIFNGMGGVIKTIKYGKDHWHQVKVLMDDDTIFKGNVIKDQFGAAQKIQEMPPLTQREIRELFDWGYCLTVHKSQGSEAYNVVVVEERFSQSTDEDWRRWLYTAVTRAKRTLTIIAR